MAVDSSSVNTDIHPKSLFDKVKLISRETSILRWILLIFMTAITSVFIKLILPSETDSLSRLILVLSSSVGCCAALAASIHCFVIFIISKKLLRLLESAAFSALSGGIALQTINDFTAATPALNEMSSNSAWLISALLLFCAVCASSQWRSGGTTRAWAQGILSAILAFALPIVLLPYLLNMLYVYTVDAAPNVVYAMHLIDKSLNLLTVLLLLGALLGYFRRANPHRQMAILMSYFLIPCEFSLVFKLCSNLRFDSWWLLSQILLLGAWLVLACKFSIQNALAHKDAIDRLDEVEALHKISWSLVGAGNSSELMNLFVQALNERLNAKYSVIYLADEDGETLQVAAVNGFDESADCVGAKYKLHSENRFPGFHSGHTARAFNTGETQVVDDILVDVEFVPWRIIAVEQGCAVSLPLMNRNQAIGVINLYFSDKLQLKPQKLRILETISAYATSAIENTLAREAMLQADPCYEHGTDLAA